MAKATHLLIGRFFVSCSVIALSALTVLSSVGCGGSGAETKTTSQDELSTFLESNPEYKDAQMTP